MQLIRLFGEQKKALEAFITRRTGSSQVAADLSQEAFLRLARMSSDQKIDNLPAFLFTIASNLIRDYQRQAIRHEQRESGEPGEDLPCPVRTAEDQLAYLQEETLLRDAIAALPAMTRQIFLLYHIEEHSYKDIAACLGITPRSVEYHLRRALIDCRSHIKARLASSCT
ncbi:RNA polymerase sigma factor [Azomonas macrocytogenes]|uniref:RNA polymerase sigma-70 factor (ECF subfamily) n=1 Tax=Azomonas macrocytogenes TaxID=69962 RepID=A0A839T2Y8_AZOMA|nr:sigma-70 family RNA polymerase sigma factor [Azomonas macrocytogenes]MBB3103468.1 RNA polymerase sigma-70 factor (ECF subfamily) [Azomonas macrocytogenes]